MIKAGNKIRNTLVLIGLPFFIGLRFGIRCSKKFIVGGLLLIGTSFLILGVTVIVSGLPNANEIYNPPKLSTQILDRNGVLLYKFYEGENRSWTPINKIPKALIEATIAIEDKDFYRHHGISFKGIANALIFNILKREEGTGLRGGSTITQQLVKNVFFSNEKTVLRKIKEAWLTIQIENKLTKDEILERYFNQVAYGGETYGVEEASIKYFGKNVWEISEAEAAFLAGLTAAPSSYSPFGKKPEFGYLRQRHVIDEMVNAGFMTYEAGEKVKNVKLSIVKENKNILAPHFVFYVRDYLQEKFGYQNVGRRGLTVVTSLDINTQKDAEKIVLSEVSKVKRMNINNGAALVLNPKNNEILAMVGSRDYYSTEIDGKYNVVTALRQPGSSIKPINYLLALIKGWSLASTVDDSPVVYQVSGQKPYSPKNYNGKFMGNVTLRTALASSLNIPSVKILATDGVGEMIDLAEKMGISTWIDRSRFGLALALGSGEVKMIELATAYSIFADLGYKKEISPVLSIDNYLGERIYQKKTEATQVIDPKMAFLINNVLSDNKARAPVFGLNSKLVIRDKTVAVKTGTTNNLKDNWCIGWTPSVLVAVWVGNNDSSPMNWVASGVSGATPIWNQIMSQYLANKPDEKWEMPSGVYISETCGRREYFVDGLESKIKCSPTGVIEKRISMSNQN